MTKIADNLSKKLGKLKKDKVNASCNNVDFVEGIKPDTEILQGVVVCDYIGDKEKEPKQYFISNEYFSESTTWNLKKPTVKPKTQQEIMDQREINYTHSTDAVIANSRKMHNLNSRYTPCFD